MTDANLARLIDEGVTTIRLSYPDLHGIARDTKHRKMSKSLGNGIDPLDVIARFGADPLRYTVVAGMGLGVDIIFDPDDLEKSFAPGRNFVTKLWNIGRFLLGNVGSDPVQPFAELDRDALGRADAWMPIPWPPKWTECSTRSPRRGSRA